MIIRRLGGLVVATLALAACAPSTAQPADTGDAKTGTLRVWLFDEAGRAPKEALVNEAVAEFRAAHKDVSVDVSYLATDAAARAAKFKGAFNDPASAPDVTEFGSTDLAGYVAAGGMADITKDIDGWSEKGDVPADMMKTVTVGDKAYGLPWWVGVRALYYRTDLFSSLGLAAPTSYAELVEAAKRIRAAQPELVGITVGGQYVFGALPFVWDAGGDLATRSGATYTATVNTAASKAGVKAYTDLFAPEICPAQQCVDLTGGKTVSTFAAGTAGMGIIGNFNRSAIDAGPVKGKYAVVPLPGAKPGTIAPAFAGGNNLGVMKATKHRTLAVQFAQLLASKKYQLKLYDALGNLPTMTSARAEVVAKDPFLKPFMDTIAAGTRFVPADPAWTTIDSQKIVINMLQKIITGKATVDQATEEANTLMNNAFAGK
ncbi:ABC transporter substrate-binding protein [Virgisporangium aliadipatigenens]|uniref:ABC transporter substrate-binding protein n=1 Tax=Virgisporangium aliadipatigenens TaxID=741659 RepID=A0A8J3YHI1_9ACTN|nr:extracellular solute-binding protein [Virgisporangium aliadipatigenens]GIJ45349.1 ABC transporter substrate-binding protein [Virgisporangium aliadipatigenens]